MKHKLFIIFALVLVFGAMMAFSVSAEEDQIGNGTKSFVVFEKISSEMVPLVIREDTKFLTSDMCINEYYPISSSDISLYSSSVSQPSLTLLPDHQYRRVNFELYNYQPDSPHKQNWVVFLPNDYILSNDQDMVLSFGYKSRTGEGYYTYGEDYHICVNFADPNNTGFRYTATLVDPPIQKDSECSGTANVVVPKGYKVVIYLVIDANLPLGKSFDIGFMSWSNPASIYHGDGVINGINPLTTSISDFRLSNYLKSDEYKDALETSRQEGYTQGNTDGYTQGKTDGYTQGKTDGVSAGKTECVATHKALVDAAFKEGESFFETFANFFFEKKTVNGEPQYSGILGGIFQAYLDVANGISLFGISLHTVLLTLLTLVVLGVGIKFVLSVI